MSLCQRLPLHLWTIFLGSILLLSSPSWALKVGLVLDKGGKDDKSFNSSAYEGDESPKDFGIQLKYVEATDSNALNPCKDP